MSPGLKSAIRCCAICCSTKDIEDHHIGGRNHLAWVTVPVCRVHHRQCHLLLEAVGVDLNYTPDRRERLIRASKAISIFQCMVHEAMHDAHRTKG